MPARSTASVLTGVAFVATFGVACQRPAAPARAGSGGEAVRQAPPTGPEAAPRVRCVAVDAFDAAPGDDVPRLEACFERRGSPDGGVLVSIRRAGDERVLWSEPADALGGARLVGSGPDHVLQVVVLDGDEDEDDHDDAPDHVDDDDYWVIELAFEGDTLVEINRLPDSGD